MTTTMTLTAIQQAAHNIAAAARIAVNLGGLSAEDALDLAARGEIKNGHEARTRAGQWGRESSREQIEAAMFQGSVAKDILDGSTRPSTGNVREYALALVVTR